MTCVGRPASQMQHWLSLRGTSAPRTILETAGQFVELDANGQWQPLVMQSVYP